MHETALRLESAGISDERYRELLYFCYQYPQKKAQLDAALDAPLSARPLDPMPRGSNKSDPTLRAVIRRDIIERDVALIERSAAEACGGQSPALQRFLLENVTSRQKNPIDRAPCGRRQFYAVRRRFFILLDLRR